MATQPGNAALLAENEISGGLTPQLKTYPLPPADFDPLTASDATLKYYGLHRRPDPKVHPLLADRWDKIYSRKINFIKPEFQLQDDFLSLGNSEPKQDRAPSIPENYYLNQIPFWSGSVVETNVADPIWFVYGSFKVANVSIRRIVGIGSRTDWVDTWIGIGGYKGEYTCRVGVRQSVTQVAYDTPTTKFQLFMQWGNQRVCVTNFPVTSMDSTGNIILDKISVLLCVSGSPATSGHFTVTNETKGVQMPFPFAPPAGQEIISTSAEWIVERPGYILNENVDLPQPAHFGQIEFDDSFAYTPSSGNMLNIGSGKLLTFNEFGKAASSPSPNGPYSIILKSS